MLSSRVCKPDTTIHKETSARLSVTAPSDQWTVAGPEMIGSGADKIAIEQNSFQCGHKFPSGRGFYDVTLSAGQEGSAHYRGISVLAEEQYAGLRDQIQDFLSNLDPTDVREPNIEHHEVRFKLHHFLERS